MAQKGPHRPKRDAAATQKRLLDAAENEFAQRGYAGARLKDIVKAASVQITLVHHYFGDKEGLYRAVLDRLILPAQVLGAQLLSTNPSLEELARGFVTLLTHLYGTHKNLLSILRHEANMGSSVLSERLREQMKPVADAAVALLIAMQKRGEVRTDLSAVEIVALTISMTAYPFADGIVLDTVLPGSVPETGAELARHCDAITLMLLRTLKA